MDIVVELRKYGPIAGLSVCVLGSVGGQGIDFFYSSRLATVTRRTPSLPTKSLPKSSLTLTSRPFLRSMQSKVE